MPRNRALCLFTVTLLLQGHQTWQLGEDNGDGLTRTQRGERVAPGFCHDGWYSFGEMCYKFETRRSTWDTAVRECGNMDSNLISIHSQEEQDFVNTLVMEIRSEVWIGLRRSIVRSETFEWKDSSPLDYRNWAEGEPNNYENVEKCAEIHYDRFTVGEWNDAMCSKNLPYICKKPKDPALKEPGQDPAVCPRKRGDWFKMGDSCYKIIHRSESFSSWSQAQSLCKSYGANLAYVKNPAVNKILEMYSKTLQGPFWIGIKSSRRHKYTWLGKNHALMYSNWQTDEPNEVPNGENCVAMDAEGKWIIRDCDESHPFICENGPELPDAPFIESFEKNMTCSYTSEKWHDIGGKYCYIIELVAKFKWREAFCRCREEGGHLASLHSAEEKDIILHYIKHHDMPQQPVFIGLVRDERGTFGWSDGSAFDYTNWVYGEPNNLASQCGEMRTDDGKWNDLHCHNTHGFICSTLKVPRRENLISKTEKLKPESKTSKLAGRGKQQLSAGSIAVIAITCLLVLMAVTVVSLYCFGNSLRTKLFKRSPYSGIE